LPIAFTVLLAAEIYRAFFLSTDVFVIYQTSLIKSAVGAVICIGAVIACLFAIRCFLTETRELSVVTYGGEIKTATPWIAFCVSAVLWSVGYAVPYFYSYVSTLRLFASCIFIWHTVKIFGHITESYEEHIALYGE